MIGSHLLSGTVKGGEQGRKQYEFFIREILGLSADEEVRPTFSCQMPGSGMQHWVGQAARLCDHPVCHTDKLTGVSAYLECATQSIHPGCGVQVRMCAWRGGVRTRPLLCAHLLQRASSVQGHPAAQRLHSPRRLKAGLRPPARGFQAAPRGSAAGMPGAELPDCCETLWSHPGWL